jgi:hypothetical protein
MKSTAEFEVYLGNQSDIGLKLMFEMGYAKILMPLELKDDLHKRIVKVGIEYDPAFIRYMPKVNDAEFFIKVLIERLRSQDRVMECLNTYLPKPLWTADLINIMKKGGFIFSLKGCQDHLFTLENIRWVLHKTDLRVSDIPAQMITQDIAHLMYTETNCYLGELPFEFRSYDLAKQIKDIDGLRKVPDVFVADMAKEWLSGTVCFSVPVATPSNAQEASHAYNQLLTEHFFDDDKTILQVLRLYKYAYLSFDKIELWKHRQTMTERILLEHYGRELIEAEGFPTKLKRTYIESDLAL